MAHSSASVDHRGTRRTNSPPPRWVPPSSREERLANHDPGGGVGRYADHEGSSSHKRRHRSSPHRSVRKHRGGGGGGHERPSERSSPPLALPRAPNPTTTSSALKPMDLGELEDINSGYNSGDEYSMNTGSSNNTGSTCDDELEVYFEKMLKEKRGFIIKKMSQDGACLFRSVADQVFGDQEMHSLVRNHCIEYMAKNADFFSSYVTEDFQEYLNRKSFDHIHGNHLEIQVMSELYNRPIEVYQYSMEPMNTFHGAYKTDNDPIRLSYHANVHYNSVVDPYKATVGVGLGLPGYQPGLAEKNLMSDATKQSEEFHLEQAMLEDKLRETDWEVTQETIEEQVARESYLQWLRDNEKRATRPTSVCTATRSASATCSSASDSQMWEASLASPEPRTSRSPRSRSNNNSAQNSPNRPNEPSDQLPCSSSSSATYNGGNLSPTYPSTSFHQPASPKPEGAVGGAQPLFPSKTVTLMNDLPPHFLGLGSWDEDDILAEVMARSQQEYLDSLKKNAGGSNCPSTSTASYSAADSLPSTSSHDPHS